MRTMIVLIHGHSVYRKKICTRTIMFRIVLLSIQRLFKFKTKHGLNCENSSVKLLSGVDFIKKKLSKFDS